MPVIINHSFLDKIAKIMPSTESTVNTFIPKVKFALGPLMIKKKMILIATVKTDKTPNIFLFKNVTPFKSISLLTKLARVWSTFMHSIQLLYELNDFIVTKHFKCNNNNIY